MIHFVLGYRTRKQYTDTRAQLWRLHTGTNTSLPLQHHIKWSLYIPSCCLCQFLLLISLLYIYSWGKWQFTYAHYKQQTLDTPRYKTYHTRNCPHFSVSYFYPESFFILPSIQQISECSWKGLEATSALQPLLWGNLGSAEINRVGCGSGMTQKWPSGAPKKILKFCRKHRITVHCGGRNYSLHQKVWDPLF